MKVFLSYARVDADFRDKVLAGLKHLKGVEVWHDLQIPPGSGWRGELEGQLRGADAAILLVSPAFLASEYCMKKELPVLVQKGIPLFPILIRHSALGLHPELSEIQFFDPRGKMEPLASLERTEREEVWARLSEALHGSANRPPRHLLVKQQREDFVARLLPAGAAQVTLRHETLMSLLDAYLELYARKLIEEAQDLFMTFRKRADRLGLEVPDPLHREVLDLLEVGLPLKPIHLQHVSRLDLESLLSSRGYATLLHGIRLTDIDYDMALPHLQRTKRPNQERCSLFAYTEAQCLRKMNRLDEAYERLKDGESFLGDFRDGHCVCGPSCQQEVLRLQIHRGFGAVCRKLAKQEREEGRNDDAARFRREAEQNLESCLALEDESIPATVRSDTRYSYGYFVFEMAFLDREQGDSSEDELHRELRRAEALFKASRDLNRTFAAPQARLAIVRQLLGERAFPDYLHARKIALGENSGESPLTALLCGFAMSLVAHERTGGQPRPPGGSALLEELRGLLEERHFSKGPLECHAFDCRVVRYGRELEDPDLAAVYDLLTEAATWETETLADQKSRLASFLEFHPPGR
ncbi:MAG: toll/interleukin-1 receptor domain-containing protein [Acidobacteriota bacterium]